MNWHYIDLHSLQVVFMQYCGKLRCKPTYSLNTSTRIFWGDIFLISFDSRSTQKLDRFSAQNDSLTLLPKELKASTWTFFLSCPLTYLKNCWVGHEQACCLLQAMGHFHFRVRIRFRKFCNTCLYQALQLELSHIAWPHTSLFLIVNVIFFLTCHCFALGYHFLESLVLNCNKIKGAGFLF